MPADGEAAPPFRPGTEPARSDANASPAGVADDDRGGWHRNPPPASADPVRALWPWVFPTGSRPVPVVGPTEALRNRAGGPETAPPPDAVPRSLDPAPRSSWQLAQEVWQESGVTWERTTPGLADVAPAYLEPPDPETAVGDGVARTARSRTTTASRAPPTRLASEPAAGDAWLDGFEPAAADSWPADPGPEEAAPADTWFTGVGPADRRFADARPADVEPVGEPTAARAPARTSPTRASHPRGPSFRLVTTPGRPGARSGPAQPGASIRRAGSLGRHGPRAAGGCRWARRSRSTRRRRSPPT